MYSTQIRIRKDVADKIKAQAEHESRSINNMLNVIIESYYKGGDNNVTNKNEIHQRAN